MTLEDVPFKCPRQFLYYTEFICTRASEKNLNLNFISLVGFQVSKIRMFFWKSLEPPVFLFSNILLYGLEQSRELRALIR